MHAGLVVGSFAHSPVNQMLVVVYVRSIHPRHVLRYHTSLLPFVRGCGFILGDLSIVAAWTRISCASLAGKAEGYST